MFLFFKLHSSPSLCSTADVTIFYAAVLSQSLKLQTTNIYIPNKKTSASDSVLYKHM